MNTCDAMVPHSFTPIGPGTNYGVKIRASAGHCSDVRFIVLSGDGTLEFVRTAWLKPGAPGRIEVGDNLAAGLQVVQIMALGEIGGCNTGSLDSWSGEINAVQLN